MKKACKNIFTVLLLILVTSIVFSSCTNDEITASPDGETSQDLSQAVVEEIVREPINATYVYGRYGLMQYNYDDDNRLVDIVTRDLITMTPVLENADNFICEYSYDENGVLNSLVYFGYQFAMTDYNEEGRPTVAVCEEVNQNYKVEFTYQNGSIVKEDFYKDSSLIMTNTFGLDGKPTAIYYSDLGTLTFDYGEGEVYVTVNYNDSEDVAPDTTIYVDEANYPYAFMQSADGAVLGYSWNFDQNNLCTNTVVDNIYNSLKVTDEYVMFYNDDKTLQKVNLYGYSSEGVPSLKEKYEYEYNDDKTPKSQKDTILDDNGDAEEIVYYTFENGMRCETITETYENTALKSKNVTKRVLDDQKREVAKSDYNYLADGTFESGKDEEYVYDENGCVTQFTVRSYEKDKKTVYIFDGDYNLDANGNILDATYVVTDIDGALLEKETNVFEYDEKGNITKQTVSLFDSDAKMIQKDVTEYVYKESGEVEKKSVSYDGNGNVIK